MNARKHAGEKPDQLHAELQSGSALSANAGSEMNRYIEIDKYNDHEEGHYGYKK